MDFQRWWGERWEAAAFKGIDLSQPLVSRVNFSTLPLNHHLALPLSGLGPSLLSCQFSALKSKMQNALAWLFGENRNCLSSFYDVLSLSRLHFNASCQNVWDLKGKQHNLALSN